jgi:hypothetical protein
LPPGRSGPDSVWLMADTDDTFQLEICSLATFHTVSFMLSLVIGVHLSGSLVPVLKQLDTRTGFGFVLILWAITWFATRAGLRRMRVRVQDASVATVVSSMTIAGGWNGVGIWVALIAGYAIVALVSHESPRLPFLFLASVLGGLLAFTVGATVGLVYGITDALLVRLSAGLFSIAGGIRRAD